MNADPNCPVDCHGMGCNYCFKSCRFVVPKDNDLFFRSRGDMIAVAYNDAYNGWKYRVPTEGFEAVQKDSLAFAERMVRMFEINLIRAHKEKIADELEKYRDDILDSRGIKNPTWIGKHELNKFIEGLRGQDGRQN